MERGREHVEALHSRYAEVRDYWAQGCSYFTTDAHRYLWVDAIDRVGAASGKN